MKQQGFREEKQRRQDQNLEHWNKVVDGLSRTEHTDSLLLYQGLHRPEYYPKDSFRIERDLASISSTKATVKNASLY